MDRKIILEFEDDKVIWFNLFIVTLFHIFAPIRQVTAKDKNKPWLTGNVYKMELRNTVNNRFKISNDDSGKEQYKLLKRFVINALNCEQKAYFAQNINYISKNSKKLRAVFFHISRGTRNYL